MHLSPALQRAYTRDRLSAPEAQRMAQFIAFGPIVFEVARTTLRTGMLEALRDTADGLTRAELAQATGLSDYAAACLTEASLSIGLMTVDPATDRFRLTKTGYFLLTDPSTRVNVDFNHDVNYEGIFRLEESLREGRPAGLEHFGPWSTVYEGLSSLPDDARRSWLAFDHFYSDGSFGEALRIVFDSGRQVGALLDVGGNTGRWALRCVAHDAAVRVSILDLPPQIAMMERQTAGQPGADRIEGIAGDLNDPTTAFPTHRTYDAIWMSQLLDCFPTDQITSILRRAAAIMKPATRLYIMETLWDRQKYETAALCLTLTSLYFTAIANGTSKMYGTADMEAAIAAAGLEIETIHDLLGLGHSIMVCRLPQAGTAAPDARTEPER